MGRVAYFDCPSGIAGNMALGALLACGADRDALIRRLGTLDLGEWSLEVVRKEEHGIGALHVDVKTPPETGHGRHLHHIEAMISSGDLPDRVRAQAIAVFRRLGEAEAGIHGVDIQSLHFHEVGAVDAIVDIVGTCLLLHDLGVDRVVCSPLPMGRGFVRCMHGVIPLPAPATVALTRGVPTYGVDIEGELVTPTGAALMTALADEFGPQPSMRVESVGYGAGTMTLPDRPNIVRVMVGQPGSGEVREVAVVETNVDDMSPQLFDVAMERLLQVGALDVYASPIQMKKNRPGLLITVMCPPECVRAVVEVLFSETTTLGVRVRNCERMCMEREVVAVTTEYGDIRVKVGRWDAARRDEAAASAVSASEEHGTRQSGDAGICKAMPEYDDVKAAALRHGVPARVVAEAAVRAFRTAQEA